MSILEASRNLGKEIQQDERFIRFAKARLANDKDEALQNSIGEFNTIRMNYEREASAEKPDETKIKVLNEQLRITYTEIMSNPAMAEYNAAKADIDALMEEVNSVLGQCLDGADPETVEPEKHECGGECSHCAGCH